MAVSSETRRFQQAEVSSWFTVVGERFKAPLPPAVSRSVPIPAVKGAMTESPCWTMAVGTCSLMDFREGSS